MSPMTMRTNPLTHTTYRWATRLVFGLCLGLFALTPPLLVQAEKGPTRATPKPLPVKSLYQLRSKWTTHTGQALKFSALRGKIRIISMIYTSCPHACPVTISDLKQLESAIPAKYRHMVGFVLVTFDPKRDTLKRLKALAKKRKLGKHWTLLRGSAGNVLELAAVLGVKYKKVSKVDFAHSNLISILGPDGLILHRQVGLNQSPTRSIKVLHKALGHKPKTPTKTSLTHM